MVKVAASLDSKHLRMGLRCNIALEMAHDITINAHTHKEGDDMLCVGDSWYYSNHCMANGDGVSEGSEHVGVGAIEVAGFRDVDSSRRW